MSVVITRCNRTLYFSFNIVAVAILVLVLPTDPATTTSLMSEEPQNTLERIFQVYL